MQEAQPHEGESVNGKSFGCFAIVSFPFLTIILAAAFMCILRESGVHGGRDEAIAIWIISSIMVILSMCLVYSSMSARAARRKKVRLEREAKERAQKEAELRERQVREEAARAARVAEKARETAVRKAREKRDRLARIAQYITNNSELAVDAMQRLPGWLAAADDNARLAVAHYQDGAFSPFWSDIEQAYRFLAEYRDSVIAISQAVDRHAALVEDMLREGGDPSPYSHFPVTLDENRIKNVLNEAIRDLGSMTYEAQKDPVFAQIWEQRRLTSAVVSGFANLETAVRDMGLAVVESIESMERNIIDSNARVEQAIETAASDVSLHLLDASKEQAGAMQRLIGKVGGIEQEVYRQNWGHYSILG